MEEAKQVPVVIMSSKLEIKANFTVMPYLVFKNKNSYVYRTCTNCCMEYNTIQQIKQQAC